jgi:hypothetical protein
MNVNTAGIMYIIISAAESVDSARASSGAAA